MQLMIGLLALMLAGAPAGQSKPNATAKVDHQADEAAIQKLSADFADAMNRGDFKAAAATWGTNGVYYAIDGQKSSGPAEIQEALSHLTGIKLTLKTTDVHWAQVDVAVVQGTWQVSGQDVNPPDHGDYTAVIAKEGRDWKYAVIRPWVPASM
jgi:ketosteroid isomerase-like protein